MTGNLENEAEELVRVVGAVAIRDGYALMARRPPGRRHAGMWEFPGGKVELGESDAGALARELVEEMAAPCVVGELVVEARDERIVLACYRVELLGEPVALFHDKLAWVPLTELADLPMPPADQVVVLALG